MENNRYRIYIGKVLQLAQTIVIKSQETAEALNMYVDENAAIYGGTFTNTLDPTTWKYYLNIAGEYHPADEQMYVVSRDTLEKITFTKETLRVHRATARDYVFGTRQYQELVAQYPQQEMLILGILNPVDLDMAISAADGTILGYVPGLIEPNEYSLVAKLQAWINGFKQRWINQQFSISDNLYAATSLGIMYLNLVPAIISYRLEACKTNEAHSYHVHQYLASHGLLDSYIDQLSVKQTLFFYRNIAYIERNVGRRDIFEWLVEHIMTERFLPIAEYSMRHDLTKQPDELYPQLTFRKKPINLGYSADLTDNLSLSQILTKQDNQARDNLRFKPDSLPAIQEQMENSLSNVVKTKILESSVIDHSNSSPYSMYDILFNHWLLLATEQRYTAFIGVTHPKSGERIPLTPKEAYAFMWYAFCKTIGIDLVEVPQVVAKRVQRLPLPTVSDLMSVVDPSLVSVATAQQALSMQPNIDTVISTEAFYNLCQEIYEAAQMQRNLVAYQEHAVKRGMVHGMVSRIYSDNVCSLADPDETYLGWFASRNIIVDNLSTVDFAVLYEDLIRESTGLSLTTKNSLKDLQAAMVGMLSQLSSYSIQIIAQINSTDIKQTDWTAVRVGHVAAEQKSFHYAPDMTVAPLHKTQHSSHKEQVQLLGGSVNGQFFTKQKGTLSMEIGVKPHWGSISEIRHIRVPISSINVRPNPRPPSNDRGIIPVIGIESYFALTDEQQQGLKDVYNNGYTTLEHKNMPTAEELAAASSLYMVPRYTAPRFAF